VTALRQRWAVRAITVVIALLAVVLGARSDAVPAPVTSGPVAPATVTPDAGDVGAGHIGAGDVGGGSRR